METLYSNYFQLPTNKARSLLNDFKWDSEKLLESFYSGGHTSKKLKENAWKHVTCDVNKALDCEICFETVTDLLKIQILQCNHRFCDSCLSDYLSSKIRDGGLITTALKCPGFQCFFELDDDLVLKMLNEPELKLRYQHVIANYFVMVGSP